MTSALLVARCCWRAPQEPPAAQPTPAVSASPPPAAAPGDRRRPPAEGAGAPRGARAGAREAARRGEEPARRGGAARARGAAAQRASSRDPALAEAHARAARRDGAPRRAARDQPGGGAPRARRATRAPSTSSATSATCGCCSRWSGPRTSSAATASSRRSPAATTRGWRSSARTSPPSPPSGPRSRSARRRRSRYGAELAAARRNLDAERARKTELLTSLVEKKEMNAAYVEELAQAETRLSQLLSGLGEASVAVPLAAFRGTLPWPVAGQVRAGFGRRKHPRFDTYTVQNGIEIEAAADAPVRAVHEGTRRLRRPFPRLRPHGRRGPRRQAPLALRAARRARRVARDRTCPPASVLGHADRGRAGRPGLYFEMRFQGRPEDPELAGSAKPSSDPDFMSHRSRLLLALASTVPHRLHRPGLAARPGRSATPATASSRSSTRWCGSCSTPTSSR